MLKKVLLAVLLIIAATLSLAACDQLGALGGAAEPEIEISDDGYVVVNGKKTEHKVDTEDKITVSSDGYVVVNGKKTEHKVDTEDEITVDEEGYLIVNGVTTEHKIDTKDEIIVNADGYVVVNGVTTEHKVDTEDEITVDEEGYLIVNGVRTQYKVSECPHIWETVTTPPTCTAEGYDTTSCKLCGKSAKSNETEKLEHDYSDTYTVAGDYHWFDCIACGEAKDKEMHVAGDDNLCVKCKIPLSATAGILYDLSADGTYAVVIGYEGTDTAVKIADTYKGVPVKDIFSEAFNGTSITSVVIPDSVTSVGDDAFYKCYSLTSVVIPDSVTSIGDYAFFNCYSLTSVVIPDSVTSIGSSAFSNCYRLINVVIGDSVTSIGARAFSNCNSALYTEYEYGRYVGDGENPYAVLIEVTNKNMSTYNIHPATRVIAYDVFSGCERLVNITIPDSVTSIGDKAFFSCYSLTSVVIGDSVMSIGDSAFFECTSLTSVVIPDSVTSIGENAFLGCDSLKSIKYRGTEEQWNAITKRSSYIPYNCKITYNYTGE
ncbi:MAG: leucine-rich repeat domain-containing protein [Clostridia bacterium]|nr:leucine-rich repeat domain-containing protein [Clostridia bacterium]